MVHSKASAEQRLHKRHLCRISRFSRQYQGGLIWIKWLSHLFGPLKVNRNPHAVRTDNRWNGKQFRRVENGGKPWLGCNRICMRTGENKAQVPYTTFLVAIFRKKSKGTAVYLLMLPATLNIPLENLSQIGSHSNVKSGCHSAASTLTLLSHSVLSPFCFCRLHAQS